MYFSITSQQLYLFCYKNAQRMKQTLPGELEKHLKKKCFGLLSYCQPECGEVSKCSSLCEFTPTSLGWCPFTPVVALLSFQESGSEGLKNTKLSHLSAQLHKDKNRAESLNELCRENTVLLQQHTRLYLCVRGFYFIFSFVTCTETQICFVKFIPFSIWWIPDFINSAFLLVCLCPGIDKVHSTSAVCHFGPQTEDPDRFGQEKIGLFWGEVWISLAKDQVRHLLLFLPHILHTFISGCFKEQRWWNFSWRHTRVRQYLLIEK